MDENEVASRPVEILRDTIPALVSPFGRKVDVPASWPLCVRRGLDLNSQNGPVDFRDEIDVRAMPYWHIDVCPLAGEPLHSGEFTNVALLAWFQLRHSANLGPATRRVTPELQQRCDSIVSRLMRSRIASSQ
jgi:hypothetical protein